MIAEAWGISDAWGSDGATNTFSAPATSSGRSAGPSDTAPRTGRSASAVTQLDITSTWFWNVDDIATTTSGRSSSANGSSAAPAQEGSSRIGPDHVTLAGAGRPGKSKAREVRTTTASAVRS